MIVGEAGIFARIAVAAEASPEAVALRSDDVTLTYGALCDRALATSARLSDAGVQPGEPVGLFGPRGVEQIIGLLGILAAGAAAVPLDPDFDDDRLDFIAHDNPIRIYLSSPETADAARTVAGNCPVIAVASQEAARTFVAQPRAADDPAIVLYTSGSTGRPKGVLLPHGAISSYEFGPGDLAVGPDDVVLHASTPACDGALAETLAPLMRGASVAVVGSGSFSVSAVARTIAQTRVTVIPIYAALLNLLIDNALESFASVRMVLSGGEAMARDRIAALMKAWPDITVVNEFGPTETCVGSLAHRVTSADLTAEEIPIGRPLLGESALILTEDEEVAAPGEEGELAIGGAGLALAYVNRAEATSASFISDPRPGKTGRLYRTGDRAVRDAEGIFHFRGRTDRQMKVAGRRVELDGIEQAIRSHPDIADAVVEPLHVPEGQTALVAFVIPTQPNPTTDTLEQALRTARGLDIHPHVFPRRIVIQDAFPLTETGKVDRTALLESLPREDEPELTKTDDLRGQIASIWQGVIGGRLPHSGDRFFDLGGTSLQLIEAHARIEAALGRQIDIAMMLDAPTLAGLVRRLEQTEPETSPAQAAARAERGAIAIVGMAARLPGLKDLDEFWRATLDGRSVIERFSPETLEDHFDPASRARPEYVPARSILRDVDQFDPEFFQMTPREAARLDPQGRIFLEVCQEALDHAALDPGRAAGRIGLYAGSSMSTYLLENLLQDTEGLRTFTSAFQLDYTNLAGNAGDDIPSRAAQKLGLTGPAISVTTACSTGLVAVIQACEALRSGRLGAALAGGVSISFPQRRGYLAQEGGMASDDGTCRPFDADANGTVFGDGAGVVVLKRLSDAIADGDTIHAVIRGVGLSNDGGRAMSYTAPSSTGQAEAIAEALTDAGLTGRDIGYAECHGTATPLGDPVEIAGLKQAFGDDVGSCALGAVKGNLGHLDAAAGIAGLIKAVLVLKHGVLPPIAHHRRLNPKIDLGGSGFYIPSAPQPWQADSPRRAGVSAFGVGGSNAHAVLEEAPASVLAAASDATLALPLSAKTQDGVKAMATRLADHLESHPELALADVARSLQQGRRQFAWRGGVVAQDTATAAQALRRLRPPLDPAPQDRPPLVFLFPGQGAQYPGMAAKPAADQTFAQWLHDGLDLLQDDLRATLQPLLLSADPTDDGARRALAQTQLAQPALLITEMATARLWQARGLYPDLCIGHSVGEITAAVLAEVMTFEEALTFVTRRGALMRDQAAGGMMAVSAPLGELQSHLDDSVDLAARNAPDQQVVAGPPDALDSLALRLDAAGLTYRRLGSSHAFHSRMMDGVIPDLTEAAQALSLKAPKCPIVSTVTGNLLTEAEATDPGYWGRQARACVDFQAALLSLPDLAPGAVLLETGPGRTLTALTPQTLAPDAYRDALPSLPDAARAADTAHALASAALGLWRAGLPVDLSHDLPDGARKVPLPSYPFNRQRCWIDAPTQDGTVEPDISTGDIMIQPQTETVLPDLLTLTSDMSGLPLSEGEADRTFLELGFDSLFLGQLTQEIGRIYKVTFGFRRLMSDLGTPRTLADFIDSERPAPEPVVAPPAPAVLQAVASDMPSVPEQTPAAGSDMATLMQAQMATMQTLFAQQLAALGGATPAPAPAVTPTPQAPVSTPAAPTAQTAPTSGSRRVKMVSNADLTADQATFAKDLARRYSEKYRSSKTYTDKHRPVLADPRTAAGFHTDWKELAFPIVAERAEGAYIYDLDGNDLVDLVNGFGQTAFGHAPAFVGDAVNRQLAKGYALGPQAELAGPLAEKFAKAVGHERVSFCNTGTEAIIAAVRAARTATGREKVVLFDKSYHGQHDEVLAKPGMSATAPTALPSAPGIPRGALGNVVVLDYASDTALDYIRANANDIAAVLVEPVRSRYPAVRPEAFVRAVKEITSASGSALIIDEVVTGFRTHPRGMQGVWNLQADIAVYGKVVGGGMPIGVVAGDARFMDALDGGTWQFGDESRPEAMPTFVAGTFVRHPLVLAAVDAVLEHLAENGERLFTEAPRLLANMAARMRTALAARGLPDLIEDYSSWLVLDVTEADPRAALLYPLMRLQGVHVMDGFCWFLTTEHGQAECDRVVAAFETALDALLNVGILTDLQRDVTPTEQVAADGPVPLTASQREIWMRHQLGGLAAAAFNESGTVWLEGELDIAALQKAMDGLIARRDALRLRFARDGSTFTIQQYAACPVPLINLTDESDPQAAFATALARDAETPFDLTDTAPARAQLFRFGPEKHALVLTAHHIVLDGWSFGLCLDDLAALYHAARTGQAPDLPVAPSFAEYARNEPQPSDMDRAFWKEAFAEVAEPVSLPTDRPRRVRAERPGDTIYHYISTDVLDGLKALGAKNGCTLFSTLFTGVQALVYRLTDKEDLVFGVPTAAQQSHAQMDLVGHLVNFLPIRSRVSPDASVIDQLRTTGQSVGKALDHDGLTFGDILTLCDIPRSLDRLPLTEIEFNLEHASPLDWSNGLNARFETNPKAAVTFDLFFNLVADAGGLRIEAHYAQDLFDAATIRAWAASLETLLRGMVADPDQVIRTLPLHPDTDSAGIDTTDLIPLPTLLADRVVDRQRHIAVDASNGQLSYEALWSQSGAIAAALQGRGVAQGDRVAVCLPRETDIIAALLGVLRAGAAFVPLDPRQPDARLFKILDDATPALVLTDQPDRFENYSSLATAEIPNGEPKAVAIDPGDIAYAIYTSGSTGTPKGVEVPHRALTNLLESMIKAPGLGPEDRLLSVTTAMFDISILEFFGPLLAGGTVVVAKETEVMDGFKLAARLRDDGITVMQATPTLWEILQVADFTPSGHLRVWAGGEPLPRDLAERLMSQDAELWNLYGPTETTIWSAAKQIRPGAPITIGEPIDRTELHVLDEHGQPCAVGVAGELNIGGAGLAAGYLGQPDRTAKAFRDVTLHGATRRLYATGDMARLRADGEIEVLGRKDSQIKLRGFRIDLGEIEAVLRSQPGINQAAVALHRRSDGDAHLVGYVVGPNPDGPSLMRALAAELPDYMIPTAWMGLTALPQTANGKLDRKALPTPTPVALVTSETVAPASETETRLTKIWAEVLGQDIPSVTTTLLELGADSLSIFRLAARLLSEGYELEARHLFDHPSIQGLAAFYDGRDSTEPAGPSRPRLSDFRHGARRRAAGAER